MVPKGWELSSIGKISDVSSGGTPSRNNEAYWNGNIPWVTTAEVQFKIIEDTVEKITEEGLANSSAKLFPAGTILMAMYGQGKTRGQVAKLGIDASTNQACAAIVLHTGYEVDFYYQFLISQYENIREMANSGGQQNLSGGIVKSIPVPVPPLTEQKKIAKILSTWDKAISVTEKLLANSQQQKKALMQQLLTGKKRLLNENGVRFSGKWIWLRAAELFKTISQKNNSEDEELLAVTQDLGVIPRSMLERRVVMPDGSTKGYKLVVSGNFIISLRSFQGGLEYSRYRGLVSPAYTVLTPIKKIVDEFYMQYYKSYDFIGHLAVAVIGIRDGKQISYEDFSFLKLPYPEIEEQQKIATVLSAADDEIATLEKKLACLRDEKKALMQQLLTGKRRVKVDEAVAE
ncbi:MULTISPECIES: restriction endonuclease subunit S [Enterobacteriaceae]|uniref:restriction endonuclease subunit S n=1 Tax=Enterobacteriaceae TaxID=543 RepID=UPI00201A6C40|nr:restriction endonuclease subunit S [Enterobacter roggenkampii]ELX1519917.1 restriction endonuclease subunit S [Escherichia coli]MCL5592444.1 restriction endonuclease subunit S [Enterobacter roggenkampii]HCB3268399.1 restriction endonuclease subunit S [Citrobacter amalonaticus]